MTILLQPLLMSLGQLLTTGGVTSGLVLETVKLHWLWLPATSVAVQMTVVGPAGNPEFPMHLGAGTLAGGVLLDSCIVPPNAGAPLVMLDRVGDSKVPVLSIF